MSAPDSTRETVYGRNPVRELAAAGRRAITEVLALKDLASSDWLQGLPVRVATRAQLATACGSGDHQGVVAYTQPYPYIETDELLALGGVVLCLDGAQDPRNLGAVARVCDAAGAAGLAIAERGSPGVTPAVCKASAGAVEHLSIARVANIANFLNDAKSPSRWVIGADADEGTDYRELDWPADAVLVIGAEGTGMRPRVRDGCDALVRIPMRGRVGSLNLSVAAAVLLYESQRAHESR